MFSPRTVDWGAEMLCPSTVGVALLAITEPVEALDANAVAMPAKVVRNFFMFTPVAETTLSQNEMCVEK